MRKIDLIVIHCSATKPGMDIGAKEIRQWHMEKGWSDIGYHWIIRRDGTLEKGRPPWKAGAHAKGYNSNSLGICLVGGVSDSGKAEDNFTDEQWERLLKVINRLQDAYPEAEVKGHRDLPNVNKECPCFDVQEWLTQQDEKAWLSQLLQ